MSCEFASTGTISRCSWVVTPRRPLSITTAQAIVIAPVHAICSTKDLATNPVSGGSTAPASMVTPPASASWPIAKYSTQPMTAV